MLSCCRRGLDPAAWGSLPALSLPFNDPFWPCSVGCTELLPLPRRAGRACPWPPCVAVPSWAARRAGIAMSRPAAAARQSFATSFLC